MTDVPQPDPDFARDILAGLTASSKSISSKWLYDLHGSELFEKITTLADYYPTRVEAEIFAEMFGELAGLIGPAPALVEFGSGASVKTRRLIEALEPALYVPIDIAEEFLGQAVAELRGRYSQVDIIPLVADLTGTYELPSAFRKKEHRLGFFPGSTIGNFDPEAAIKFMAQAREAMGPGAQFLISTDLVKPREILERAYDDSEGVTAAFNLNLLTRINRELGADFDLEAFRHVALFNDARSRIEMHLEAMKDHTVSIAGQEITFAAGERIHTENSYKYSVESFSALAKKAGWQVARQWQDGQALFSVYLLSYSG